MMQIAADALEAPDVRVSAYSRLPVGCRAVNPNDVEASAYLLIVKPDLPEMPTAVHTFLRTNLTHENLAQCMLSSYRDKAVLEPLKHLPKCMAAHRTCCPIGVSDSGAFGCPMHS